MSQIGKTNKMKIIKQKYVCMYVCTLTHKYTPSKTKQDIKENPKEKSN